MFTSLFMSQINKFIIFAPTYDENIGGVILLHKLCHLLNAKGIKSFIFPFFNYAMQDVHWMDVLLLSSSPHRW